MSKIYFETVVSRLEAADSEFILRLPKEASAQLPSRGMLMAKGTINHCPFQAALEPDDGGSHWFKVNPPLLEAAGANVGDTVTIALEPTKEWPEPKIPTDLQDVLADDAEAHAIWDNITPMARWDWIRWIGAVKQLETRKKRVESIPSRLKAGKRRPCCFDRSQCTLTDA